MAATYAVLGDSQEKPICEFRLAAGSAGPLGKRSGGGPGGSTRLAVT